MTKQEQARWDEVRKEIADYLTKQFVWYDDAEFPKGECYREAAHILSMASIAVLHPEQKLPERIKWATFNGDSVRGASSIHTIAQQDMLSQGWKRVL